MKPDLHFNRAISNLNFSQANLTGLVADFFANSGFGEHMNDLKSEWLRGHGPIPAGEYQVSTTPYPSTKAKSNFYHITPDPVTNPTDATQVRGELGIHCDKPPTGSNGCIVLPEDQFAYFKALMAVAKAAGHDTLNLSVS